MGIDTASIKTALKEGSIFFCESVRGVVGQRIAEEHEASFRDASDAGIENTVRALLLADVSGDRIVSVTHDVWGVSRDEVARMACSLRHKIALEKLDEYLIASGESERDISAFFAEYAVSFRLTRDSDLLKLWNEPDKLYHRLLKQGKTSNPLNLQGQVRVVRRESD